MGSLYESDGVSTVTKSVIASKYVYTYGILVSKLLKIVKFIVTLCHSPGKINVYWIIVIELRL